MKNRFLSLLGFSLLACASFNASANTSSDSIRAELEKLRLVNVKCAAVSNDPFDAKHLNCYTNVYNRASQLGSLASKYINNEEFDIMLGKISGFGKKFNDKFYENE